MSSEPEKPIEKLLRDCAKERRDKAGDSWELHPATRRLLQQEVTRRFGRTPEPTHRSLGWLLGQWWLRSLGGLALIAAIGVAAFLLSPGSAPKKSDSLLAKNEVSSTTTPSSVAPTSSDDKAELKELDSGSRFDNSKKIANNAGISKQAEPALRDALTEKDARVAPESLLAKAQPPPGRPNQNSPSAETAAQTTPGASIPEPLAAPQSTSFAQRYGLAGSSALGTPQAPTTAAAGGRSAITEQQARLANDSPKPSNASGLPAVRAEAQLVDLATSPSANAPNTDLVQYGYFAASQTPAKNNRAFQLSPNGSATRTKAAGAAGTQPTAQVLVSFRIEQSGQELRVIDSDNSVYVGPVLSTNLPTVALATDEERLGFSDAAQASKRQSRPIGTAESNASQQSGSAHVFQVVGTNRTSNQRVVFSGTLSGNTNNLGMFVTNSLQFSGAVAGATAQLANVQSIPSTQNLYLSGTAQIGPAQEIHIEAVSAPPQQR